MDRCDDIPVFEVQRGNFNLMMLLIYFVGRDGE